MLKRFFLLAMLLAGMATAAQAENVWLVGRPDSSHDCSAGAPLRVQRYTGGTLIDFRTTLYNPALLLSLSPGGICPCWGFGCGGAVVIYEHDMVRVVLPWSQDIMTRMEVIVDSFGNVVTINDDITDTITVTVTAPDGTPIGQSSFGPEGPPMSQADIENLASQLAAAGGWDWGGGLSDISVTSW